MYVLYIFRILDVWGFRASGFVMLSGELGSGSMSLGSRMVVHAALTGS